MEQLLDMGFPQSQCEIAMELSNNNAEVALNYLLTGEIIATPATAPPQNLPSMEVNAFGRSAGESFFGEGCDDITTCDVSQYSFGDKGGRSACTSIALEAATTLLNPSSGLLS